MDCPESPALGGWESVGEHQKMYRKLVHDRFWLKFYLVDECTTSKVAKTHTRTVEKLEYSVNIYHTFIFFMSEV